MSGTAARNTSSDRLSRPVPPLSTLYVITRRDIGPILTGAQPASGTKEQAPGQTSYLSKGDEDSPVCASPLCGCDQPVEQCDRWLRLATAT